MKKAFLTSLLLMIGISVVFGQDSSHVEPWEEEFFFIDEAKLDSGDVFTFWGIYFGVGSVNLLDTSLNGIQKGFTSVLMQSNEIRLLAIADYLRRNPSYIIEIGVHRDCRGSAAASQIYTMRRAMTLVEKLVSLGVDRGRLIPKGFEESQPYNDKGQLLTCEYIMSLPKEDSQALHQKNRRFQLRVISKAYAP